MIDMTVLGSSPYKNQEGSVYCYMPDSISQYESGYEFRIQSGALQFIDSNDNKIEIPNGFTVVDNFGLNVPPYENAFYIIWVPSYELHYNTSAIWKMIDQKQQLVMSCNSANVLKNTVIKRGLILSKFQVFDIDYDEDWDIGIDDAKTYEVYGIEDSTIKNQKLNEGDIVDYQIQGDMIISILYISTSKYDDMALHKLHQNYNQSINDYYYF